MKRLIMKKKLIIVISAAAFIACNGKSTKNELEVTGTITNNPAKMIYLEKIPVANMQPAVVDSAVLDKNGKYVLKTDLNEASVFNLRLDRNEYPLTSIINDTSKITVDATFSKENSHFAESYEVKGSIASQQLKDFMYSINNNLQRIYLISRRADSLTTSGHESDSLMNSLTEQRITVAKEINQDFSEAISKSNNPALTMFELGYYQTTANNPAFKIQGLDNKEVTGIVNDVAAKFPEHQGVQAVKRALDAQMQKNEGLVGKQAPEIVLPDVNGKVVKLSSFKGKYVLVDFWASWCGPCRHENPNVVKAYNQFKDKNFTILGVSLDGPGEKEEWVKAIMKDSLTWTQVSELKEWESAVVSDYNFQDIGIPFNVLVDPDGKVIAEELRGGSLQAKLQEVLK
jgi:peroxiredoxin